MKVSEKERDKLISMWARADTLAFMAFIPIRRKIKENDDSYITDLFTACSMATLACDLNDLVQESIENMISELRYGRRKVS